MRYLKSVSLDIIYLLALMLLKTFLAILAGTADTLFYRAVLAQAITTALAKL